MASVAFACSLPLTLSSSGQHATLPRTGVVAFKCRVGSRAHSCSGRGVAFFIASLSAVLTGCTRVSRKTRHGSLLIRQASNRSEGEPVQMRCGGKLMATVTRILDNGLLLHIADGSEAVVHAPMLQREKEDYKVGEKVEVTILRLPVLGPGKTNLKFTAAQATDRHLKPMKSAQIGSIVDGRVLHISDRGLLLDINVPRTGYSPWRYLEPLGKDRTEFNVGDTIRGLKVRGIHNQVWKFVQLLLRFAG